MRRVVVGLIAAIALAVAGTASASGPAPPGKDLFELDCEGLGTITVSVPTAEDSSGAAQIVGQRGHLIPVRFEFTLLNVTTGTVVFSEPDAAGGGNAHRNQATTTCTVVFFEGPASELLEEGEELPPGVAPSDIVRALATVEVVVKR